MTARTVQLGLRANLAQFSLLVLVNAFVGAMIGMERSILPAIAVEDFHLAERVGILSFIAVFGVTKALSNYLAGRLGDRYGRKHILVAGWLVAVPVPFMLMWAPDWNWVLAANALLGISQGLTWSTTVIMKIDLVGPRNRGLAMGLNEFAGYVAVAASALLTGWIAARYGLRPEPFYPGVAFVVIGLALSILFIRETSHHVAHEVRTGGHGADLPSQAEVFRRTSFTDRNLSSISQAGLVNNLNDGMAWGIFPLFFAAASMNLDQIGLLAALYPGTWGIAQLFTGALSDRIGRKWLIATGMWVQAGGHRGGDPVGRVRRLRHRGRSPRPRHRHGLSDAPGRDRRRRPSRLAGVGGGRLPPVARPRLCRRRAGGGHRRRRPRPRRRDVDRRRAHLRLRHCRRGTHAGTACGSGRALCREPLTVNHH